MSDVNQKSTWDNNPVQYNDTAGSNSVQPNMQYAAANTAARPETVYTTRMKKNFAFFGPATFLYAALYAFCMYKNSSGIAFPFFVTGSFLYLCLCLSRLEISLKRGSVWYMIGMMLLAVSTFCTDDWKIINLNKTGIFFLMMSLLLKQFYDTAHWNLGKYLLSIGALVTVSLGEIYRPFADMAAYLKEHKGEKSKKLWSAVLGAVIAVPLLFVVAALLAGADAVFRQMTNDFYEWMQPANIFNVVFRIAFIFFASYMLVCFLCKKTLREEVKDYRKGEPVLAITITSLLSLLYLLFSGIQILGLFLGKMELPANYTYAEYAREGFFQLLAVSILNLVIVLCTMHFFRESKMLKVVLTVMSLCTFVMIASSAMRMIIYVNQYDLTFLRIFVLWALMVLFLLFTGVIITIFAEKFPLFRYSMAVITILYLTLSFSHPDYIIAKVNLRNVPESMTGAELERSAERYGGEADLSMVDYRYLAGLSADAAPVLIPYLDRLGYDLTAYEAEEVLAAGFSGESYRPKHTAEGFGWYYLDRIKYRLERMSPRTYNISRHMALCILEKFGVDAHSS